MNISKYIRERPVEVRRHIRLDPNHSIKFTSDRMDLITRVAKMKGVSLSEFCKVAALKEARLEVMRFRKDKIEMAKKIIEEEEERRTKEAIEKFK